MASNSTSGHEKYIILKKIIQQGVKDLKKKKREKKGVTRKKNSNHVIYWESIHSYILQVLDWRKIYDESFIPSRLMRTLANLIIIAVKYEKNINLQHCYLQSWS